MSGSKPIDRRTFLRRGGTVLGAAALAKPASVLARPGITRTHDREAPRAVFEAAKPKRGGTLIVGSDGGDQDTLDPQHNSTDMDQQRVQNLYDGPTVLNSSAPYTLSYALADEITLNKEATVATVSLKKGIEFHNGKTLTAEDLMYTIKRELDPTDLGSGHSGYASIDPNTMYKLDNYTVRFPLKFPDSMFHYRIQWVIPEGFDPLHPVGTGPFKVKSFTPGVESTFVRNENYWGGGTGPVGQPFLDEVQILDFSDDTSRGAALLSGQILAMDSVDPTQLGEFASDKSLTRLVTKSGFIEPITMRVDLAPFSDNRVRQAMRLIVNRPQMVEQGYAGWAQIANDMPEPADPAYPHLPQVEQDIDQAKSLLKAAGYPDLTATFTIAPEKAGLISSAQVFAQQAAAAGVTLNISNITPTAFNAGFANWAFTDGYWSGSIIGTFYATRYLTGAGLNDSHWNSAHTNALYYEALKDTNEASRNQKFGEILSYLHSNGPDVIPVFQEGIDLYNSKLQGFQPFVNGWSLNAWRYREVWFQ
jgi:peptide/nickel transport system substrate-binding protein